MFLPCILILCPPPAYRLLPYKFSCFTHGIPHTTPRTTQRRNDLKSVLPAFENSTQSHLHQTQSQSQKPCHRSITSTSSPDPSMIQVLVFPSASQQSNTEPSGNRSPQVFQLLPPICLQPPPRDTPPRSPCAADE